MRAWRSTLVFALASSTLSLTGMGTRSIRRASSCVTRGGHERGTRRSFAWRVARWRACFSSSRTASAEKSFDNEKSRSRSMSLSVGFR